MNYNIIRRQSEVIYGTSLCVYCSGGGRRSGGGRGDDTYLYIIIYIYIEARFIYHPPPTGGVRIPGIYLSRGKGTPSQRQHRLLHTEELKNKTTMTIIIIIVCRLIDCDSYFLEFYSCSALRRRRRRRIPMQISEFFGTSTLFHIFRSKRISPNGITYFYYYHNTQYVPHSDCNIFKK